MTKLKIKKTFKIMIWVVIFVSLPIILWLFGVLLWFLGSTMGIWIFTPTPAKPEVTYGEFPFEIVYEIDGETVILQDVYICKYDGIGANEGVGKHRRWKGYIKSSGQKELILLEDEDLKLACTVGYPEYYMSDPSKSNPEEYTPSIYYIKPNELGGTSSGVMDIEPILEQYKIKLISWKLSEPIQNSFE